MYVQLESTIHLQMSDIFFVCVVMIPVDHVKFIPQNNTSSLNITQHYGNYPRFHASFQRELAKREIKS